VPSLASYAERLRNLLPSELQAEIARLGTSVTPQSQLQLALALAQLRQVPELIRAQETVSKVLGDSSDEARALHPVAKLLAVRFNEERRLEDLLDKQNQQVKDLQRRLDQTTERLEALKAIERSLVSRPTTALPSVAPSVGGSRARTVPATAPTASTPTPAASPARSGVPPAGLQP
jgi:predicted nuclease with TOPRIM domain